MRLPIRVTDVFAEAYERLKERDLKVVDRMLDKLETSRDQPEMRSMLRIGDAILYATPPIHAHSDTYRITWRYDDRDLPTWIECVTLASIET